MTATRRLASATATMTGLGLLGLGYALYEARDYRVRQTEVPLAGLPVGTAPLRVLHLSDLHLTPSNSRLSSFLGDLPGLRPDLVVCTGDFIAHQDSVPLLVDALGSLLDLPGAFVLGSNDYYAPRLKSPTRYLRADDGRRFHGPELPWHELVDALSARGWTHLGNQRGEFELGGVPIGLRGVDDPHIERDDYAAVAGPGGHALELGVAHAPYRRVLDAMAADGVDLALAGHTHGGQLRLPPFGALVTNCDLDRGRARGLSRHAAPESAVAWPGAEPGGRIAAGAAGSGAGDRPATGATAGVRPPFGGPDGLGMWLHVSEGLGTSPFTPVRFCCPPTATLLTLTPQP